MDRFRARSARRRAVGPFGDARTDLLVVGSGKRRNSVASRLKSLDLEVRVGDPAALTSEPVKGLVGVVLVEPLGGTRATRALEQLRSRPGGDRVPVFAVVAARPTTKHVNELYRRDVTAVFEWPREAFIAPHVIAELLGVVEVQGRRTDRDTLLARGIRGRLRLHGVSRGAVRVDARGGTVRLEGVVDSLWRKNELIDAVRRTPGVHRVDAAGLRVEPGRKTDQAIARSVREIVKAVSADLARTIAVSVERGRVSLAGNAPDRRQVSRMVRLTENVEGVRAVENLVTVTSSRQHRQDRVLARALQQALDEMFPGQRAAVAVFGGVAVATGKVKDLRTKTQVGELLEEWPSVERMVNKLQVTP